MLKKSSTSLGGTRGLVQGLSIETACKEIRQDNAGSRSNSHGYSQTEQAMEKKKNRRNPNQGR